MATALSLIVLAGAISTFSLLLRTGLNSFTYSSMSSEIDRALDQFSGDVRLASDVRWASSQRLTLILPTDNGLSRVTYAFESADVGGGRFVRQMENGPVETLVEHVTADFAFERYGLPNASGDRAPVAGNDLETKQLALRLCAIGPGTRLPAASQTAASARCVLRNKLVGE